MFKKLIFLLFVLSLANNLFALEPLYYQGTLEQYNIWHTWVCHEDRANIPEEGKINFVNGVAAPDKQRTIRYSRTIAHPENEDDYIFKFGVYPKPDMGLTEYTEQDTIDNGYLF